LIYFLNITWLFLLGSFLGFLLEVLYHFYKFRVLVNKQGLWYGPFKPIYGIGLILLTLSLYHFKDKSIFIIFLISLLVGTLFEYLCFMFQEKTLHAKTWSYTGFSEKICTLFSLTWGILGIIWIKLLFPIYLKVFNLFSNNTLFIIISIIIFIFLIYDLIISFLIVNTYSKDKRGIKANKLDKYIKKKYLNKDILSKFTSLSINKV